MSGHKDKVLDAEASAAKKPVAAAPAAAPPAAPAERAAMPTPAPSGSTPAGMYGDSPGVRGTMAVVRAIGASQDFYQKNSPLTVRPSAGASAGTPAGTTPPLNAFQQGQLDKNIAGRFGKGPVPTAPGTAPGTAPARPDMPAPGAAPAAAGKTPGDSYNEGLTAGMVPAGENPLLTNRRGEGEIIAGSGEPWSADAKGYLDSRMPNVGDSRMALPGGGYGSAGEALDMNAHWNPQRGDIKAGQSPNIFRDLIPQSIDAAISERFPSRVGRSVGRGNPGDILGGVNSTGVSKGRWARIQAGLEEARMQQDTALSGQGVQERGQDMGFSQEGMRQGGESDRNALNNETNRRGQDFTRGAANEGHRAELMREGIQQDTSFGVANRNLAGQIYSADQRQATVAASTLAKNSGMDDSTVNKLMEISVNPDTGSFDPDIFKTNYQQMAKMISAGGGTGGGGQYREGAVSKTRDGRPVVYKGGKWVPAPQK